MEAEIIRQLTKNFEEAAHQADGLEIWFGRDLQTLLGYSSWQNFCKVIEKAKIACQNSAQNVTDHFVAATRKVKIGSDGEREIDDVALTRYACYLTAQNGDPNKDEIAFAMTYFAIQTRKQELMEERIGEFERLRARYKLTLSEKELSQLAYERGVDNDGFGRIRSKGDEALFNMGTQAMKRRLKAPQNRPLADFLPTITIKAKDFATEMTNFNIKKADLYGEPDISKEHVSSNKIIRNALNDAGIKPEELPPAEDIQKIKRRVEAEGEKLARGTGKLSQKTKTESKT